MPVEVAVVVHKFMNGLNNVRSNMCLDSYELVDLEYTPVHSNMPVVSNLHL